MEATSDPREHAKIVSKLLHENGSSLQLGSHWNLISSKWWNMWKSISNYDELEANTMSILNNSHEQISPAENGENTNTISIEPINNADILESNEPTLSPSKRKRDQNKQILKTQLVENINYILVPQKVWKLLHSWYKGGPEICRRVIGVGLNRSTFEVEVYPLRIKVLKLEYVPPFETEFEMEISKAATSKELKGILAQRYGFPPHKVRLWFENKVKIYRVLKSEEIMEDLFVSKGRIIVELLGPTTVYAWKDESEIKKQVEVIESGKSENTQKRRSLSLSQSKTETGNGPKPPKPSQTRGVTGLENLGNTCFMNSALQCLSNTKLLTQYFLSDLYIKDINPTNPLGMQGKIAEHYAYLLKKIWAGNAGYVSPGDFKWTLGKFAPQFSGYKQQDSQELLAFLLDGLHEDLNKVISKPYTPPVDTTNKTDDQAASESWQNHLARNKSIIVDIFQGQLKSTLHCPLCNNIAKTFDPFMYLSLPLPIATERNLSIYFFPFEGTPKKISFKISKKAKFIQVKQILASHVGSVADRLIPVDIYYHKITSIYSDDRPISLLREGEEIRVFETPPTNAKFMTVKLIHRRQQTGYDIFASPMLLFLPIECTNNRIYTTTLSKISYLLQDPKSVQNAITDTFSYPFYLRITNAHGTGCSGCIIPNNLNKLTLPPLQTVSLDWPDFLLKYYKKEAEEGKQIHENEEGKALQLADCFRNFLETEKLGENDEWYCPQCKQFQQATKKFDIFKLPKVLVVHLKRFLYNRYSKEKLDMQVEFPVNGLDLSNFVSFESKNSTIYDLFAVSVHSGGLSGGHYVAYAKNSEDNQWYNFNDSSTSKVSETEIKNLRGAYVLFYQRRET